MAKQPFFVMIGTISNASARQTVRERALTQKIDSSSRTLTAMIVTIQIRIHATIVVHSLHVVRVIGPRRNRFILRGAQSHLRKKACSPTRKSTAPNNDQQQVGVPNHTAPRQHITSHLQCQRMECGTFLEHYEKQATNVVTIGGRSAYRVSAQKNKIQPHSATLYPSFTLLCTHTQLTSNAPGISVPSSRQQPVEHLGGQVRR